MNEFARKFHEALVSFEDWINAPPEPCLACRRPYDEHREGDERCPGGGVDDIYVNPDAWAGAGQ